MDSLFFYILDLSERVQFKSLTGAIQKILNINYDPIQMTERLSDFAVYVELKRAEDVEKLMKIGKLFILDRPYVLIGDNVLTRCGSKNMFAHFVLLTLKKRCEMLDLDFVDFLASLKVKITKERDDGPWILTGPADKLKLFDQKAKELLLFNKCSIQKNASNASEIARNAGNNPNAPTCSICLSLLPVGENLTKSLRCGHTFHSACLNGRLKIGAICPNCRTPVGPGKGDQPPGGSCQTRITYDIDLPGYPNSNGVIEIRYKVPDGIQGANHPNPGLPYTGSARLAYLPNDDRGSKIARLLSLAFYHGLIFTVGQSMTTLKANTVVWAAIPHKTRLQGGPEYFGYPDPHYLDDVENALKNFGIDESCLN